MPVLLIFTVLAAILVGYSLYLGITPNPTNKKVMARLLSMLPSLDSGVILELGSGWGHLACPLAKQFPGCSIIGYELSPLPWAWAQIQRSAKGLINLKFLRKNFYHVSFHEASIVVCYLFPGAMNKLRLKFESELKPGTWVVSNTFSIPSWTPIKIFEVNDLYRTKIYLYRFSKTLEDTCG
jgi:hypothetical protein